MGCFLLNIIMLWGCSIIALPSYIFFPPTCRQYRFNLPESKLGQPPCNLQVKYAKIRKDHSFLLILHLFISLKIVQVSMLYKNHILQKQ